MWEVERSRGELCGFRLLSARFITQVGRPVDKESGFSNDICCCFLMLFKTLLLAESQALSMWLLYDSLFESGCFCEAQWYLAGFILLQTTRFHYFLCLVSILFHWSSCLVLCQYKAFLFTMACDTSWSLVLWYILFCFCRFRSL